MKKSHFTALILGTTGVLFLGVGMCMSMLPEWNLFREGIAAGCFGLFLLLIMALVYRRMEHKTPVHITFKTVMAVLLGIAGVLILGAGMCFTMVFNQMLLGIAAGISGILLLFCLIPLCVGLK
ncbi:hypothetical protein [Clostridium sp. AM58-1XD]|uniref:hypothetical protein n=1 Tax=Clostridium sp. AM58-1XD TaxID=2292307 RepID=UPI000E4D3AF1|nr:hypothetical protein [Clostridium sp. AM58-1XD]RGY99467.1 hypothetical protein DXA13_08170 [Clostridium sp. AM58-1XD]